MVWEGSKWIKKDIQYLRTLWVLQRKFDLKKEKKNDTINNLNLGQILSCATKYIKNTKKSFLFLKTHRHPVLTHIPAYHAFISNIMATQGYYIFIYKTCQHYIFVVPCLLRRRSSVFSFCEKLEVVIFGNCFGSLILILTLWIGVFFKMRDRICCLVRVIGQIY